jgi:hypothetical protein
MNDEPTSWQVVYEHLLQVESHWTAQIQNQQQRIATIVSMNGILLGFLGFEGLRTFDDRWVNWSAALFGVGLIALALALLLGIDALRPRIAAGTPNWLSGVETVALAAFGPEHAYQLLAERLATDLADVKHLEVINQRRKLMRRQLGLIAAGLVSLALSVALPNP